MTSNLQSRLLANFSAELVRLRDRTQAQQALIRRLLQLAGDAEATPKARVIDVGVRQDISAIQDRSYELKGFEGDNGEALPVGQPEPKTSSQWWPTAHRDQWPLLPAPGWDLLSEQDHIRVSIGMSLIGADRTITENRVKFVHAAQLETSRFNPVFITDDDDFSIFRDFGFTAEFIDVAALDGRPENVRAALLRDSLAWIRRKWNLATIVNLVKAQPDGLVEAARMEEARGANDGDAIGEIVARSIVTGTAGSLADFDAATNDAASAETMERSGTAPPLEFELKAPFLQPAPAPNVDRLRQSYEATGLRSRPDTFAIYRIIGNSLPPRHEPDQSIKNVTFILENEPDLADCEKWWVVNRIFRDEERQAILDLLDRHNQNYLELPFDIDEYRRIGCDYEDFPEPGFFIRGAYHDINDVGRRRAELALVRSKNNYVMNNNGARNVALAHGRERAKWALPWDGNCFVTAAAWDQIVADVTKAATFPYFVVPMARILDNSALLDPNFRPDPREEPQLIFRADSTQSFNAEIPYGRRPKVELFWRLGIPGPWDNWARDIWDVENRHRSEDAGAFEYAGWVARLSSGQDTLEHVGKSSFRNRGRARDTAIVEAIDRADEIAISAAWDPSRPTQYDPGRIGSLMSEAEDEPHARELFQALCLAANEALARGPYSVVDKKSLPPSGSPHDYWHPAPYWWPNPGTADGLPYVRRDGMRVPGTNLYEEESDRYDRTRLQRLFDDSTILALASVATEDNRYAEHAAAHLRTWFIDPATRMAPHLRFAQTRLGHNNNEGVSFGLIEMKDLYFYLDAVRIMADRGALSVADVEAFRSWLEEYVAWLVESDQGQTEYRGLNNHGTCYDLQVGSIFAYLGDTARLIDTFRTSEARLLEQFDDEGVQPHELSRSQTEHYCAFNIQSWINLSTLAQSCGVDLWNRTSRGGSGLRRGIEWLLPYVAGAEWPFEQIEQFDGDRYLPIYFAYRDHYGETGTSIDSTGLDARKVKPIFYPHDGIKPFWMLG